MGSEFRRFYNLQGEHRLITRQEAEMGLNKLTLIRKIRPLNELSKLVETGAIDRVGLFKDKVCVYVGDTEWLIAGYDRNISHIHSISEQNLSLITELEAVSNE